MVRAALLVMLAGCSEYDLIGDDKAEAPAEDEEAPPEEGEPAIAVDPVAVDFGVQVPGWTGTEALTISSVGTGELELRELVLTGAGSYTVAAPELEEGPLLLEPGEQVTVLVSWDAVETDAATLSIPSDDAASPLIEVPLSGSVLQPDIVLAPELVDLGEVAVGESASGIVVVSNAGEADLSIEAVELAHDELGVLDDGGLTGAVLAPGESGEVRVSYAPDDVGADEGTLLVWSDDPDTPDAAATVLGEGIDPIITYAVEIELTADDRNEAWLDGVEITGSNASGWSSTDLTSTTLDSGTHVLAVYGTDVASVIAGFIATIRVDGTPTFLTGVDDWKATTSTPGSGWDQPGFDDSAWSSASPCSDTSPWGSAPSSITGDGADWVWISTNCRSLGAGWFRLEFELE